MSTITKDDPQFNAVFDEAVKIMEAAGAEITGVDALRRDVDAIVLEGNSLNLKLRKAVAPQNNGSVS